MCCPENTVMEKENSTQDSNMFCNHASVLRKKEKQRLSPSAVFK